MFSITVNGKKVEGEIHYGTALDYELEFGTDMLADINGSVDKDSPAFVSYDDDGVVVGVDYSAVPWSKYMRVLWCAIRSTNPRTKPFSKWAADVKRLNIVDVRNKLDEDMKECFFCDPAVDGDGGD